MKKKGTNIIRRVIPRILQRSLRTELQFPQLVDDSPDSILITNTKGEIYYVNPAWEKLTGYTYKEVIGKNPRFLSSRKTSAYIYKKLWETLTKGKPFSSREIVDRKKNGKEYQIHATFFPVRKRGKSIFFVQMLHDITHQKEVEQHKDSFIGIASHELKTPIASLSAYSQILERRLQKKIDEKDMYFVRNIKIQIERLNGLIDDLLNVSRIDSGKLELQLEEIDLNELVKNIIIDFQYSVDSHELVKEGNIQGKVLADDHRIEQVLTNLLTNAIKYSPQADKVIVRLANDEKYATVTVQDFGRGIGKKDLPHIFERFYRTKEKDERRVSGFGLGLYISASIIKKHKGKIWVESKKGKGSTFSFSLPLC